MKILVIGSGGREHAIIKKIKENKDVTKIYALPGNAGMKEAVTVDINIYDYKKICKFAVEEKIDYAIVSPDNPLIDGCVDELEKYNIPCFGPEKKAAIIEGSKVFSKNLMKKYNIPTAKYETFTSLDKAISYLEKSSFPIVIKADGPALGKGVIIAETLKEAKENVTLMMKGEKFGKSGEKVVIEEFLEGNEVSVLAFTDGETILPMVSSMDHKRALDNDKGLNTGGMGAVAPNPYYTEEIKKECMEKIYIPTVKAMNNEGRKFKGCLYFGLIITKDQVKVIEYNCRFGDPETQAILPLLKTDLLTLMMAVTNEKLSEVEMEFKDEKSCCVVLASNGYPKEYTTGHKITIDESVLDNTYMAGVKGSKEGLITNGGRVLGVTATDKTLEGAIKKAYEYADKISFENKYMRKDIGQRALR